MSYPKPPYSSTPTNSSSRQSQVPRPPSFVQNSLSVPLPPIWNPITGSALTSDDPAYHVSASQRFSAQGQRSISYTTHDPFSSSSRMSVASPFSTQASSLTGYPTPPRIPVASNVLSEQSYINKTPYIFDNLLLGEVLRQTRYDKEAQDKAKLFAMSTVILVLYYKLGNRTIITPLGTGVVVSNTKVITAKHVINSASSLDVRMRFYAASGYYSESGTCKLYKVIDHAIHYSEDIAVLTVRGEFLDRNIEIDYESSPGGEYWVAHHAGGLPTQISTGEFPAMLFGGISSHLNLLIHAGPLASGAGVFNHVRRTCIGIVIRRSTELEGISRKLLCFSKIKAWLQYEIIKENWHFSQMDVLPPLLKLGDFIDHRMYVEELYGNALETINRKQILSHHIPDFYKFIDALKNYLAKGTQMGRVESLLQSRPFFDVEHQSYHAYGGVNDKTWLHQNITGDILDALGKLVEELMFLYLHIVKEGDHIHLTDHHWGGIDADNIAFDFGFNIASDLQEHINPVRGKKRRFDYTIAFYDGDKPDVEQAQKKFHFYPVSADDKNEKNVKKLKNTQIVDVYKLFEYLLTQEPLGFVAPKIIRTVPSSWKDYENNYLEKLGLVSIYSLEEGDIIVANDLKYVILKNERNGLLYSYWTE